MQDKNVSHRGVVAKAWSASARSWGYCRAAGIEARRVPLSGAMSSTGFGGDVLVRDGDGEARWK